jgi:hypothetical protein
LENEKSFEMNQMDKLSNDVIIKRAKHGSIYFLILAMITSLGMGFMVVLLTTTFNEGEEALTQWAFITPMLAILSLTVAYWMLWIAAKRGNPNAAGITMLVIGISIAINFALQGWAGFLEESNARTPSQPSLNFVGLIIPILLFIAFYKSRNYLLELKKRDLWDHEYGSKKSSRFVCHIGGTLLVTGLVLFFVGSYQLQKAHTQRVVSTVAYHDAFIQLIEQHDQPFIKTIKNLDEVNEENLQLLQGQIQALQAQVDQLLDEIPQKHALHNVLSMYGEVVSHWREAVRILGLPILDMEKVNKEMMRADRQRELTLNAFDQFRQNFQQRNTR